MRHIGKTKQDAEWLKRLGRHIEQLILGKGYKSAYDFWINKAGDDISRASLNFILSGRTDPKATTLRTIAKLLGVKPSKLFEFD